MIETFKWRTQVQDSPIGEFKHRVREVVFGDGYKQVAGDGINPESQSWPITYTGLKVDVIPILTFIRQHTTTSFIWISPLGEKGLYRVKADSISMKPAGGRTITISATFEQAFSA